MKPRSNFILSAWKPIYAAIICWKYTFPSSWVDLASSQESPDHRYMVYSSIPSVYVSNLMLWPQHRFWNWDIWLLQLGSFSNIFFFAYWGFCSYSTWNWNSLPLLFTLTRQWDLRAWSKWGRLKSVLQAVSLSSRQSELWGLRGVMWIK